MPLQVGVNVLEVDGPATPTLQPAPTSVAAFVGRTRRGVPDRAVRVTDPSQFLARTGAPLADAYTGLAVLGFFLNGGRETYVVRVVGVASAAASRLLTSRRTQAADSLLLRAGYRGEPDPGQWGNALRVDVRDDPQASTKTTTAVLTTDTGAVLDSLSGLTVGSVLRFPAAGGARFRVVSEVDAAANRVTWEGALGAAVAAGAIVSTAEFRLLIRIQDETTGGFPVVEDWRGLSMQSGTAGYVVDRLNHPATGSRFIAVADVDHGVHPGENLPAIASGLALVNGSEDPPTVADFLGSPGAGSGLRALDTAQPQLIAVPDAHLLGSDAARTVALGAIAYCAGRGDCMFVGAPPDRGIPTGTVIRSAVGYTETVSHYVESIKTYAAGGLQGRNVYGALYAPWIIVSDVAARGPNPVRPIPPDGHILGIYARTELVRGVFKAPAGDAATLLGAGSLSAELSDGEHTDLVQNGHVNGIRALPARGIVVASSRTLSSDPRWLFVNVRLLFNFVKLTLRDGLRFVRQEPNTEALRRSVAFNVVTPFLLGLWQRGAFGSDPPASVFTVKCDAENNPPAQVDLGNFRLEVYFYPVRPAETVQIIVGQLPSGGTAAEA